MRILLLTQYFPPEPGATQNRLLSFVQNCSRRGIPVTVLTALPNYPSGRVFPEYRGRWLVREKIGGADIIRVRLWPRRGTGWLARGLTYSSFALSALIAGIFHAPQCDVLFWETPPLVLGPAAYLLSRIKGVPLVTNVSDLWPASLRDMGLVSDGLLWRFLKSLEVFLYRRSHLVSGQTQHIIDAIGADAPATRTCLWRNGADIHDVTTTAISQVRESWGVRQEQFVVGYAGLFGMSQGLKTICQAAALVNDPRIVFVLVGEGPMKTQMEERIEKEQLTNVLVLRRLPHDAMPAVWGAFDCALVCLRRLPLFLGAIPSKMFEAMAAARPVVLAVEGEAAEVLTHCDAGITIPPEDPERMAGAIMTLQADPELRARLGRNGREAVRTTYNRATFNNRCIDAICEVAGERGAARLG